MERLTIEYCGEYVPKGLCSKAMRERNEDCTGCEVDKCFDKLGKYEDLEEQGKG